MKVLLHGEIEVMSLPDLFQLVEINKKMCVLNIFRWLYRFKVKVMVKARGSMCVYVASLRTNFGDDFIFSKKRNPLALSPSDGESLEKSGVLCAKLTEIVEESWRKHMGIEPTGEISHPPHRF